MAWRPVPVRKIPNPDPSGKHRFIQILPQGTMRWTFTMKVDEAFSKQLEDLGSLLEGDWSKASLVRLALERLAAEANGEVVFALPLLPKKDLGSTPSSS